MPSAPVSVLAATGEVFGLPLHPLVVHAVVVLIPLSALGLLAIVFVRRWRAAYGPLVLAGLFLAAVFAFLAESSGEALAHSVGEPRNHAEWGERLPAATAAAFIVTLVWWLLQRRATDRSSWGVRALGGIALVVGLGLTTLAGIVGHTGAMAAWGGAGDEPATSASPSATASESASTSAPAGYTLDQVAEHATAVSCWATINGDVYDLTTWIQQHPGGENAIRSICGLDASVAFNNEHGHQDEPNEELTQFWIGPLLR
ncbi:MAG: cytochrome b5 domain-containing protein [Phycicoccus sp.]|nr:cytochrome b5 domain-containing protein [Phycicoccus sp.]